MGQSPYRRLDALIGDATLVSLEVDERSRQARLRLAVPPSGEPGGPWQHGTFLLGQVCWVAACLRPVRYQPDPGHPRSRPGQAGHVPVNAGPPLPLRDLADLNDRLRRWSGHELAGQPGEVVDAAAEPDWLDWASLELAWPDRPGELHTLDLALTDNGGTIGHRLDVRIGFGTLEVVRSHRAAAAAEPPGQHREVRGHTAPRRRRRRVAGVIGVVAVLGLSLAAGLYLIRPDRAALHQQAIPPGRAAAARGLPAAEAGLLPWRLAAPVSREVAVTGPRNRLVVLGGLTAGGVSVTGIYAIGTRTGSARQIGVLRAPLHDAAAAVIGGRAVVFGGGSSASVAGVQAFPLTGGGGTAASTGSLPAPRSDSAAVTIGGTSYVVGGYTGSRPDAPVLATTNGTAFTAVVSLPVPVRYPAVAALAGRIFVFGGEAIAGPRAGAPVNLIQAVDPARHAASVVGHLPEPLAGAAAVTVGGELFVAGGESTTAQPLTPGIGTTQLGPGQTAPGGTETAAPTSTVSTIWAFDPASGRLLPAGRLQVPVSHAAVAVAGGMAWIVGGESHGALTGTVQMLRPNRAFGTAGAPGAGSPYFGGRLLIADRGNNRLLLLTDTMQVAWRYPSPSLPRDPLHFYFPDDAFFSNHGTAIVSNQEQNDTVIKIAYPSGKIVWSYGHPRRPGTGPGYLHEPDDAYLLRNGQMVVADAVNCRVLLITPAGAVVHQIGTNGVCVHNPPASIGSPNGDTPLADGNLLVSEINGSWVSEFTPAGKLVWTVQLPIGYPSDPQQLGPNRYLIADYVTPGQILEFNRQGRILYRYHPASGPGALNHPSLVELLPSGVFMVNDDFRDRMVAIDPGTGALVWQYGITGRKGTGPGRLHIPDGFDLVLPDGSTPTHRTTG
ncbi:MAG TPA: PQQ-binding-like beta-propeller repeat protein [Streptosporangiaceae bacterium]